MESNQNKEFEPGQEALLLLQQIAEMVGYSPDKLNSNTPEGKDSK